MNRRGQAYVMWSHMVNKEQSTEEMDGYRQRSNKTEQAVEKR